MSEKLKKYRVRVPAHLYFDVVARTEEGAQEQARLVALEITQWDDVASLEYVESAADENNIDGKFYVDKITRNVPIESVEEIE